MNPQPLIDFAEIFAYCPCCEESRECLPECTIFEDTGGNEQYEYMVLARQALVDSEDTDEKKTRSSR